MRTAVVQRCAGGARTGLFNLMPKYKKLDCRIYFLYLYRIYVRVGEGPFGRFHDSDF